MQAYLVLICLIKVAYSVKRNLLRSDFQILKKLSSNPDKATAKADRCNIVVVLDRPVYAERMTQVLENPVYVLLSACVWIAKENELSLAIR
ncbi:hypothetical protein M514_11683 [Trichuris suis]|uniref:Uncharacterized protein n=1 Tax=Trichuris suis TaxID=68888 RepID=A0A085LR62_9BILA|nr:hypothetical protein M513_11683 [Trichuris suis]KFD60226.1 hypothetical protein M514_11683 [Trichuris suis]